MIAFRFLSPYRSRLLGLEHCVVHALAPFVVAAGNRCRAGGWHIVHEVHRYDVSSGRTHVLRTIAFLSSPHKSGKRPFRDLKIRGHIETMCWCPASNSRFPELGHQRYVPLGVL